VITLDPITRRRLARFRSMRRGWWSLLALLALMVAATAGGFWGARWSKRVPVRWVRRGVIATGLVMSAVFFVRAIG
jgi:uncharacterized membrane protein YfcA